MSQLRSLTHVNKNHHRLSLQVATSFDSKLQSLKRMSNSSSSILSTNVINYDGSSPDPMEEIFNIPEQYIDISFVKDKFAFLEYAWFITPTQRRTVYDFIGFDLEAAYASINPDGFAGDVCGKPLHLSIFAPEQRLYTFMYDLMYGLGATRALVNRYKDEQLIPRAPQLRIFPTVSHWVDVSEVQNRDSLLEALYKAAREMDTEPMKPTRNGNFIAKKANQKFDLHYARNCVDCTGYVERINNRMIRCNPYFGKRMYVVDYNRLNGAGMAEAVVKLLLLKIKNKAHKT